MRARRIIGAALAAATLALCPPAPASLARAPVQVAQNYRITATLDVAAGRLDAELELELTNRSPSAMTHVNLSVVPRALGFLTMEDPVRVDGDAVDPEWTTRINLRVPLARTADLAVDGLIGLEEAFGAYPWPDLVLAEVGSGGGFSMEYPRMIHLTRDKVADPYVVYHEVAHQWFYAQVGNDQQTEPWLDEALADFSARYLMGIGENACSTRPVDSAVFAWEAGPTTGGDWTSCDGYFHAVFYQGSEFLTAVRGAMGDDAFFDAMRDWVASNRHGFATGRQLLSHLQRSTSAALRPIYRRFLTDAGFGPTRAAALGGGPLTPRLK